MNGMDQIQNKDITNDVLFKEVMLKNKSLCKEWIQRCVPDIKIGDIEYIDTEKEISLGTSSKKIRIDAYAEDTGTKYAIEMMTYHVASIEKYSRYHQSMLDVDLDIGEDPAILKDTIVIILCTYDPLGYGLPMYTIQSRIDEKDKCLYKDGRRIVIVTNKGENAASQALKPIVKLLAKKPGNDGFTEKINKAIETAKVSPGVRRAIMDENLKWKAITNIIRDQVTAEVTEEVSNKVTNEVTEKVTNEITEKVTNEVTEKVREEVTKSVTDEVTKRVTEDVTNMNIISLMNSLQVDRQEAMRLLGIEKH